MTRIGEYIKQAEKFARLAEAASEPAERKRMIRHANDLLLRANQAELRRDRARVRVLASKKLHG